MKILGCDLHGRQQSIAMVDTETGEFTEKKLNHEGNEVREFYAALEGPDMLMIRCSTRREGWLLRSPRRSRARWSTRVSGVVLRSSYLRYDVV